MLIADSAYFEARDMIRVRAAGGPCRAQRIQTSSGRESNSAELRLLVITEMPPYIAPETHAIVGFWGKPSSTLDWCEENYVYSFYIAEFCKLTLYQLNLHHITHPFAGNSSSNAAMILPSLLGIWYCLKYGVEWRYLLCFISLLSWYTAC